MRLLATIGASLALLLGIPPCWTRAEEISWRPAAPAQPAPAFQVRPAAPPPLVLLGAPQAMPASGGFEQTSLQSTPNDSVPMSPGYSSGAGMLNYLGAPGGVVRGQVPDSPPPPPPSPFGPPGSPTAAQAPAPGPGPAADAYNCGINTTSDKSTLWERFSDKTKNCFSEITGGFGSMFKPGKDRQMFQSDHEFDMFSSPVSSPFLSMDPRSLTEVKPLFMYEHSPGSNPAFAGGFTDYLGLQGRIALTEHLSFNISELGFVFMRPGDHVGYAEFEPHTGFAELHFGPQLTFYRNTTSNTVAAAGVTFELPVGAGGVFQDTGPIGFTPYLSFAQNFLRSDYGSVNFMNTTGWSGGPERSGFVFSNFHFDYNILNKNRFFPMIELNWAAYTNSGTARLVGFEGWDMYNFGSEHVAGQNEMSLNFGGRVRINDFWWVGVALGFNVLGDGAQHMDALRLTVDMVFRY